MYFDIQGIRYYADIWGNGFPFLLLHGFTGNSSTWKEFTPVWSEHSKAFAIDIIGHGKTDSPIDKAKYDIEAAADDLNEILEKLEIEQTDILGYSMGGRLALTFAMKYPEKVRKLILESSSPGLDNEEERKKRRLQDEKLAEQIRMNGLETFIHYWENIPLFRSQQRLPETTRNLIRKQRMSNNEIGLINSLYGMGTGSQPSWWGSLEQLTIPTLIMTGSLDNKFCHIANEMTKSLKNSQWQTIEDCGHAIHVENPEIFGTIVSGFLNETYEYIR
ncbi:2-succinyl-6-hydroxy-2,4-cyclohexadiene-1-carboxylate synthase [Bacillus sp. Bva_UNVM-123]|uniref:2-succinyl-6-hydroxy-2, 4-cyclohexadiene-1-carboxylate synthase n=1 Tax=Bacillus sp. Bva_UNVM-123 TaxID=2829798 RepID=UPI00391F1E1F